jgi:putative transposase
MKSVTSKPEPSHPAIASNSHLFDDWFDPIEDMIRGQVRGLIEEMIRGELDATLSRPRYGRLSGHSEGSDLTTVVTGHRHGSRVRTLTGTFGKTEMTAMSRTKLKLADELRHCLNRNRWIYQNDEGLGSYSRPAQCRGETRN